MTTLQMTKATADKKSSKGKWWWSSSDDEYRIVNCSCPNCGNRKIIFGQDAGYTLDENTGEITPTFTCKICGFSDDLVLGDFYPASLPDHSTDDPNVRT